MVFYAQSTTPVISGDVGGGGRGVCKTILIKLDNTLLYWAHQMEIGKLISVKTAFKFKLLLILSLLCTSAVHAATLFRWYWLGSLHHASDNFQACAKYARN